MAEQMTLPDLQEQLDELVPGAELHLKLPEVERLFGVNDVATGRLRNFASSHNCVFAWSPTGVQFLKQPVQPPVAPRPGAGV
jgi:hypothetical protein